MICSFHSFHVSFESISTPKYLTCCTAFIVTRQCGVCVVDYLLVTAKNSHFGWLNCTSLLPTSFACTSDYTQGSMALCLPYIKLLVQGSFTLYGEVPMLYYHCGKPTWWLYQYSSIIMHRSILALQTLLCACSCLAVLTVERICNSKSAPLIPVTSALYVVSA